MIKLSSIKPNPDNPRLVKDDKFFKLCESIKEFGEKMMPLRPIVIDENNIILGGNMRYKALKELGYKEVPDEWIKQANELTEAEKQEFIIKDNVGFGEWEWDVLANEWDSELLDKWGLDIPDFVAEVEAEAVEDDYEEPDNLEVDVVEGDLIEFVCEDGRVHRLICGDSTCSDSVAKLMNGEKADMVFTDPPYGVDYEGINNDQRNGLEDLLREAFANKMASTKAGGAFYCFHSDRCADIFNKVYREFCHFSSMIIWVKESIVLSQTDYQSKHEPCFYGWFNNGTHKWFSDRKQQSVWFSKRERVEGHTTPKPIDIISSALNNSSKKGMIVLDLFMGSGSTLVASHQIKRLCYGIELDPKYCQVIIDRMQKLDPSLTVKINGEIYEKETAI